MKLITEEVARVKSSPTTLYPSLVLFRDPTPLDETPSLTPSPIRFCAILPIGVERSCAFPLKLFPS